MGWIHDLGDSEARRRDLSSRGLGLPDGGVPASWHGLGPDRVKHPYVRGPLLEFWRQVRAKIQDPVDAWASIVADDRKRQRWQRARGRGGFRRSSWDEVLETVAAALLHTARKHGPDRVLGFGPVGAGAHRAGMGGSRFLELFGGVTVSGPRPWPQFHPRFEVNPLDLAREAQDAGAADDQEIVRYVTSALARRGQGHPAGTGRRQSGRRELHAAAEDEAAGCWPRVWIAWQGDPLAAERTNGSGHAAGFLESAARGKVDLVVDHAFRMDAAARDSDIVLPAAPWPGRGDRETPGVQSAAGPPGDAGTPAWETRDEWETFGALARRMSELAPAVFPLPVKDVVGLPAQDDGPEAESEPRLAVVERDYPGLYHRFVTVGPLAREGGFAPERQES